MQPKITQKKTQDQSSLVCLKCVIFAQVKNLASILKLWNVLFHWQGCVS